MSTRRLTLIALGLLLIVLVGALYEPVTEKLFEKEVKPHPFGQQFIKTIVDASLTKEEVIELNQLVSKSSTLVQPDVMYAFLEKKGVTQYLSKNLNPTITTNSLETLGVSLWQIGFFMAVFEPRAAEDFLVMGDKNNMVEVSIPKEKIQYDVDKMLTKSRFTVGQEDGQDKVLTINLFDENFLKSIRFSD